MSFYSVHALLYSTVSGALYICHVVIVIAIVLNGPKHRLLYPDQLNIARQGNAIFPQFGVDGGPRFHL